MVNSLIMTRGGDYKDNMATLCVMATKKYNKTCYISFNEAYHFIISMLENSPVDKDGFYIVDASTGVKERKDIDDRTVVMPVGDLFNVYLFLRSLIQEKGIDHILVDSISALIDKHSDLPLSDMLTDLLLETGRENCDMSLVVHTRDIDHDVVNRLRPLVSGSINL